MGLGLAGWGEADLVGMEEKAVGCVLAVEGVAQNGVAEVCHVDSQLVGASGQGSQGHAGGLPIARVRHRAPKCLAGFARFGLGCDMALGPVRPIKAYGRVQELPVRTQGQLAPDPGQIQLANALLLEHQTQ